MIESISGSADAATLIALLRMWAVVLVANLAGTFIFAAISAQHGVFYIAEKDKDEVDLQLKLLASYAYTERKHVRKQRDAGEARCGCGRRSPRRPSRDDCSWSSPGHSPPARLRRRRRHGDCG